MDQAALRHLCPPDWTERASCLGLPADWWFPEGPTAIADATRGKAVCATCPVRVECLDYGQSTGAGGIWGGRVLALGRPRRTGAG
jgi:hypothetical protein